MSSSERPQGNAPPTERKGTITNLARHLIDVDFGAGEDGTRRVIKIPSARMDPTKELIPGRLPGVPSKVWDQIKAHATAGHLVKKGKLLFVED